MVSTTREKVKRLLLQYALQKRVINISEMSRILGVSRQTIMFHLATLSEVYA